MLGIEAVDIVRDFDRKRAWGIGKGRTGDAAAMKLAPASGEAGLLGGAGGDLSRQLGRVEFGMDEPNGLRQEGQEQGSGEKLRAAEAFAGGNLGHKAGRSVLP